eukprot:gnl/Chilomastix_cuspidata/1913.p1 GENE.gnl/Chilomastix_cuspidata/1913~~gnl/Chilomastix_cuspidata/1913.p1  ORF type:complete len:405 (-),score=229.04 gnl/Chilomastix_cuspidata/1913:25-1167(-)
MEGKQDLLFSAWELNYQCAAEPDGAAKERLIEICKEEKMPHLLNFYSDLYDWKADTEELLFTLNEEFMEREKLLQDEVNEALEKNISETQTAEKRMALAEFYAESGDPTKALAEFAKIGHKSLTSNQIFDFCVRVALVHFARGEFIEAQRQLDNAAKRTAKVDFERRNRLTVLGSFNNVRRRKLGAVSGPLFKMLPTFSCTDYVPYTRYAAYAVVACLVTDDYPTLLARAGASPEIRSVARELGAVKELLDAFVRCEYRRLLPLIVVVCDELRRDFLFHDHADFLVRLLRAKAYDQYLLPFASAKLSVMAREFGVAGDVLVEDLFLLISEDKLHAKMDLEARTVRRLRVSGAAQGLDRLLAEARTLLLRIDALRKAATFE